MLSNRRKSLLFHSNSAHSLRTAGQALAADDLRDREGPLRGTAARAAASAAARLGQLLARLGLHQTLESVEAGSFGVDLAFDLLEARETLARRQAAVAEDALGHLGTVGASLRLFILPLLLFFFRRLCAR